LQNFRKNSEESERIKKYENKNCGNINVCKIFIKKENESESNETLNANNNKVFTIVDTVVNKINFEFAYIVTLRRRRI
jgi:hypothetical protein